MSNAFNWRSGDGAGLVKDKHFTHKKNFKRIAMHKDGLPDIPPHQQKNINTDKRTPADKNTALRRGTISPALRRYEDSK